MQMKSGVGMSRVARIVATAGVLVTVGCGGTVDSTGAETVPSTSANAHTTEDARTTKELSAPPSAAAGTLRLAASLKFMKPYAFEHDSKIDSTYALESGSMTVLSYESDVTSDDGAPEAVHDYLKGRYSWSALKVKICYDGGTVDAGEEDSTSISVWPWVLELSDETLVSPLEDDLPGFPHPLYPTDDEDLPAGACRTGNIIFAVPHGKEVSRALYIRQGMLPVAWTSTDTVRK
ncbi:hypothetical protein [Streptomyces rhizosphaerihabitans]|uniref:hypothetical protein n=1 Tax=Streptomyces rhizosphaerihabitans TaxID=1266770 RepID=UPI0021BFE4A7|nr:hypothetical protein [Streptomyces rhizosphaerihabitans]MCT9003566.1 hypothetical protein [Streptomyces rhizosphaerihabitans]